MREISDTITTAQCKPGSSYEAHCQHCSCSDAGIYVCKLTKCDPDKSVAKYTFNGEQLDAERLNRRVCLPNEIKIQVSLQFHSTKYSRSVFLNP